jgi:hypothetical protein
LNKIKIHISNCFFFNCFLSDRPYPFLVTNRHVVEQAALGRLTFTAARDGMPVIGDKIELEIADFAQQWFYHPDSNVDLAILPVALIEQAVAMQGKQVYFHAIDVNLIPTQEELADFDALESVVFFGYPNGVWDHVNLMPIIRRGRTATFLQFDFEGRAVFLIDASVYPGSSGSPVFLYNPLSVDVDGRFHFIGVISSVFYREEEGESCPTSGCAEMIDLGLVVKAQMVRDAIWHFSEARLPAYG